MRDWKQEEELCRKALADKDRRPPTNTKEEGYWRSMVATAFGEHCFTAYPEAIQEIFRLQHELKIKSR